MVLNPKLSSRSECKWLGAPKWQTYSSKKTHATVAASWHVFRRFWKRLYSVYGHHFVWILRLYWPQWCFLLGLGSVQDAHVCHRRQEFTASCCWWSSVPHSPSATHFILFRVSEFAVELLEDCLNLVGWLVTAGNSGSVIQRGRRIVVWFLISGSGLPIRPSLA